MLLESRSQITRAILLLNVGLLLFVIHDALSKVLMARYPVFEIIFMRSLFALPLVVILLRLEQGSVYLRTRRFWMLVTRGLLSVAAFSLFLVGLKLMPLADCFAISMAAPLLVAALSGPLLGEPATRRQWFAVVLGFAAVLFMTRPGGAIPLLGAVVMLCSVTAFSVSIIVTRSLGRTENTSTMTVFVIVIFVLAGGIVSPFDWHPPSAGDVVLLMVLGVLASGAMFCSIYAYKHGPPALMVPFQYTSLVWAVLIGYLVWGDIPDLSVVIGGVVVVGSGLLLLRA